MNADGLIWLGAFPLLGGSIAAWVLGSQRDTRDSSTLAYYLLVASYGMVGLLTAQLAWALHKVESPRVDDAGVQWLGESVGRLGFAVDAASLTIVASSVLLGLGALLTWTRVGTRLEETTLRSLAWGSMGLGFVAMLASTRNLVLPLGAWIGLAWLRSLVQVTREANERPAGASLAWESLGVVGFAVTCSSLVLGAGSTDLLLLRTTPIEDLRQVLVGVPLADWAAGGLVVALVCSILAQLPGASATERGERDAIQRNFVRVWLLIVLPWFALAQRVGKLFALAPTVMAVASVAVALLVLAIGFASYARPDADEAARREALSGLRAWAASSWWGGGVVLGCFLMGSVWGALLALWGFGAFALLRSSWTDAGAHQQQHPLFAGLMGLLGIGVLANAELFFAALSHDSAASPGINYLLVALWALALLILSAAVGRACVGFPTASRSTWLGWVAGTVLLLAALWPGDLGGMFEPHQALALTVVYGSFSDAAIEFHVGPRAAFVGSASELLAGPRWMCFAAAFTLPLVGLRLGATAGDTVEKLAASSARFGRVLLGLRNLPLWVAGRADALSYGLALVFSREEPSLLSDLATERAGAVGRRVEGRWSASRKAPGASLRYWAVVVLLFFGWLYFKPSVTTLLPNHYHSFGGLRPELQRAKDPSAERRARQAKARDAALEAAGQSTTPQIERIERPGVGLPEEKPE